jgi:hypothetical protein
LLTLLIPCPFGRGIKVIYFGYHEIGPDHAVVQGDEPAIRQVTGALFEEGLEERVGSIRVATLFDPEPEIPISNRLAFIVRVKSANQLGGASWCMIDLRGPVTGR